MDIVSHSERKLALEMQTPGRVVPLPDVSPLRKKYRIATEVLALLGSLLEMTFRARTDVRFRSQFRSFEMSKNFNNLPTSILKSDQSCLKHVKNAYFLFLDL